MADSHYLIEKTSDANSTISNIYPLSEEESVKELARMLGGVVNYRCRFTKCKRNACFGKTVKYACLKQEMPAILSENLDMGAFFMRKNLKQFYIVLLVFHLVSHRQVRVLSATEAVFSTQKQTAEQKVIPEGEEYKVYASGIPIGFI